MMSFPPEHFVGKKVTVMGLGHFGGQISAIRFLVAQGARVIVTDIAPAEKLAGSLARISDLPVELHLGGHIEADFTDVDLVVVSPAVPKKSRYLRLAEEKGVPVTSEMNLFLDRCRGTVLGVTGTVGKSTTVAMLDRIFQEAQASDADHFPYRATWMGGNIGKSLLEDLAAIQDKDLVILELSSFQLEDLAGIEYSPQIALVTNIFPNHFDRHVNLDRYIEAKANVTRYQMPGDFLITNGMDPNCARLEEIASGDVVRWRFGVEDEDAHPRHFQVSLIPRSDAWVLESNLNGRGARIITSDDLPVPGVHNMVNAAAAAAAALAAGLTAAMIAVGLRQFKGLVDRLELVAEIEDVRWYNDSKSTTPQSGIVALRAFPAGSVIVIVGGYDKELDLSEFAKEVALRSKAALCLGQTGPQLAELITAHGGQVLEVASLGQAIQEAARLAERGECVLLSPGCASWDMFENYQARGREFRQLVRDLVHPVSAR